MKSDENKMNQQAIKPAYDINEQAFKQIRHDESYGKYVVISDGKILAHFTSMMSAITYTRDEVTRSQFALVIFTKL
jgi:hypothetical protein